MRKSLDNNKSYQSNFSDSKSISETGKEEVNTPQQFFDTYSKPTVNIKNNFKAIEMIRESSQQYRD